jgi:hypothetical protein
MSKWQKCPYQTGISKGISGSRAIHFDRAIVATFCHAHTATSYSPTEPGVYNGTYDLPRVLENYGTL